MRNCASDACFLPGTLREYPALRVVRWLLRDTPLPKRRMCPPSGYGFGRFSAAMLSLASVIFSNRIFQFVAHVVAPLVIGAWIYIAWRTPDLLVFDWLYAAHIDPTSVRMSSEIPYFIQYCLPDGCWVYAGTSWMLMVWRRILPWVSAYVILGVGGEFGQFVEIVPGTFEWLDVLACLGGFFIPFLVFRKCTENTFGPFWHC